MKAVCVLMEHNGETIAPQKSILAYYKNYPIQLVEIRKELRKYKGKEGYVSLLYLSAFDADNLKEKLWISKVGRLSTGFKSKQFDK